MKPVILSFTSLTICILLITSCQRGEQKEEVISSTPSPTLTQPSEITENYGLPFSLQYNKENNRFSIIENKETLPVKEEEIVIALNNKYPQIQIEVEKRRHDTLFVRIPDATNLTQSMGITGATFYLIEATYGFTSINGIHVVNYSFTEGDHASPGPYTRESFNDFFN